MLATLAPDATAQHARLLRAFRPHDCKEEAMVARSTRWFMSLACWGWALVSVAAADDRVADVLDSIAPPDGWLNQQEQAVQYPRPTYSTSSLRQPPTPIEAAPAGEDRKSVV